jgi:hypothetical protein
VDQTHARELIEIRMPSCGSCNLMQQTLRALPRSLKAAQGLTMYRRQIAQGAYQWDGFAQVIEYLSFIDFEFNLNASYDPEQLINQRK